MAEPRWAVGAQPPGSDRHSIELAEATHAFLAQRDLRSRSRTIYGQTLNRLGQHLGDNRPLGKVTPQHLQSFMEVFYLGTAPATWNLNLAALRSFYAFARRQGWVEADPSAGLARRQLRRDPDGRVILQRQLEILWRRDDLPLREKTLWRLLYDTAARTEEILALDVDDLDLDHKTATVLGKGGRPRQLNWYTHSAHLLARLVKGRSRGPLFLSDRRPLRPVATVDLDPDTGRARLSYRRAAELFTASTGWTLHQLRHTRIRELMDTDCPLPLLQKITGHLSLRTLTEHYPGPSPDAVRAWYDATDPGARRPKRAAR